MKVNKTFSIDAEVMNNLDKQATELSIKANILAEQYIREGIRLNSYFEVTCSCGAKYSSKLPCCPGCKALKPSD